MADKYPVKIYGNTGLSERVNQFQQQADKHKEKQQTNPFSSHFRGVEEAKKKLNRQDSE